MIFGDDIDFESAAGLLNCLLDNEAARPAAGDKTEREFWYNSAPAQKRIEFKDDTLIVLVPRLDYSESVTGRWAFTHNPGGVSSFTNASVVRVDNLNTHYIADANDSNTGRAGSSAATVSTAAIRDSNGRLLAVAPSGAVDAELVTYGFLYSFTSGVRDPKTACLAAFDGAIPVAYTWDGGNQTITSDTLVSVNPVDGQTLAVNDRVAVLFETGLNAPYNGIYIVTQVGSAGVSAFILQRAADADSAAEVTNGMQFWVTTGTTWGSSGWLLTTPDGFTLDADDLTFVQNNGTTGITAGGGMTKTGNTLDVVTASASRIVINADSIDLAATAVTPGSYGGPAHVGDFIVDTYGRITYAASTPIAIGTAAVTYAGSPNVLAKYDATGAALSTSTITDDGTTVTINSFATFTSTAAKFDSTSGAPLIIRNPTAAAYTGMRLYNDQDSGLRSLEINYSGSTFAGSIVTGAPTGEAASIATTGAYPLVLGTSNTARFYISATAPTLTAYGAGTITTLSGTLTLNTGDASAAIIQTNSTTRFTVSATSALLTGTGATGLTAASGGLTLNTSDTGVIYFATNNAYRFILSGTAATLQGSGATLFTSDSTIGITPGSGFGLSVNLSGAGDFIVNTDDLVVDTSSGFVGVGTTSPGEALDVVGNVEVNGTVKVYQSANTDYLLFDLAGVNTWRTRITADNTSSYIIGNDTGGVFNTKILTLTNSGNVGVGTTGPSVKLHVTAGSGETTVTRLTTNDYVNTTTGTSLRTLFGAATGNTYVAIGALTGGESAWGNLVLQSGGGNVGVGTTGPASKLDVAGSVRVTGASTITTGEGINMFWSASIGTLISYDNVGNDGLPLQLRGSTVTLKSGDYGDVAGLILSDNGASAGVLTLPYYTTAGGILQVTGGVVSAPASIPAGTTIGSLAVCRFQTVNVTGDDLTGDIVVPHSLATRSPGITVWRANSSYEATERIMVKSIPTPTAETTSQTLKFTPTQTSTDYYVVALTA